MNLKDKQKRFCEEYVKDHNGTQAAIRAEYAEGSAKVTASRLLTNDNVKAYIEELEREIAARNNIEVDDIIEGIRNIIEVCTQTLDIKDKDGKVIAKKMLDPGNALRAWEDLARIKGAFRDKQELAITELPKITYKRG